LRRLEQGIELAKDSRAAAGFDWRLLVSECALLRLGSRGMVPRHEAASRLQEEALTLSRQTGDSFIIGIALADLAELRVAQKRYDEARELGIEGVLVFREARDRRGIAWALESLAKAQAA
jgi:hypothetical protein